MKIRPRLLVPILAFVSIATAQAQEKPDFDPLASQAAAAIQEASKGLPHPPTILILDFVERYGSTSELSAALTDEFTDRLRAHAQGFVVLRPSDLRQTLELHNLPQTAIFHSPVMKCYASELELSGIIEGELEYGPGGLLLNLHTPRIENRNSNCCKEVVIPMTSRLRELMGKPAPAPPPFFTQEDKVWINPDHPPVSDSESVHVTKAGAGYTPPACLLCQRPEFSPDAMRFKVQGTVVLKVQISPGGVPVKISLVRGLPCGLTDKAFEAVEHWIFKPAARPDGVPVAVEQGLEVTFHLY